ncbi:MAG: substrate-binding domain-containing protein, partial [Trebonia sp.]
LEHLREAGAQLIALIAAGDEMAWNAELTAAHRGWCDAHGVAVLQAQVPTFPRPEYTDAAAARLLRTDRPDAIVCSQPGAAAALVRTLTNRGVRVPDDVLVASCVDDATAAAANPPVTAVDLQPALLGRRAATLLAALLSGRAQPGTDLTVPTRLVVRASTTAPSR